MKCEEERLARCGASDSQTTTTSVTSLPADDSRDLEEDQPSLVGFDLGALPVVEIILQVPVTDPELEILEDSSVLHEVQAVVDIHMLHLGEGQGVLEEIHDGDGGGHVVVGVGGVERGVLGVADD